MKGFLAGHSLERQGKKNLGTVLISSQNLRCMSVCRVHQTDGDTVNTHKQEMKCTEIFDRRGGRDEVLSELVSYFSFQTGSKCFLMSSRMESSHIQKLKGFPGMFSLKKEQHMQKKKKNYNEHLVFKCDIMHWMECSYNRTEIWTYRTFFSQWPLDGATILEMRLTLENLDHDTW